jgi:hypothetical protein
MTLSGHKLLLFKVVYIHHIVLPYHKHKFLTRTCVKTALVTPGIAPTLVALPRPKYVLLKALISDDLPVLGRPTTMSRKNSSFSKHG